MFKRYGYWIVIGGLVWWMFLRKKPGVTSAPEPGKLPWYPPQVEPGQEIA